LCSDVTIGIQAHTRTHIRLIQIKCFKLVQKLAVTGHC